MEQRETTFLEATAESSSSFRHAPSLLPWCSMQHAFNASIFSRPDPHCSPFFLGSSQQPAATRTDPKSMAGATSRNGSGIEWMLRVSEHAPTVADRWNAPCQACLNEMMHTPCRFTHVHESHLPLKSGAFCSMSAGDAAA